MSVRLQHALEALYGLERRKDKHDLNGITALLRALGDPHTRFRSVHVAGTNGKGSVCAAIERVLREAGFRTGLFTSPHLIDFRERIRVSGRWADEDRLARKLEQIGRLPEGRDRTFFEVCTALAFDYFAEQEVEIAVVEVGLGGRLDCTNVISPEVSVITSIGLDHTEILGDTIEKIAAEKAGIIKRGVPVVLGAMPDAARTVIEGVAGACGVPIARPTRDVTFGIDIPGHSTSSNLLSAMTALAVLVQRGFTIPPATRLRGLAAVRWPGRLERSPNESLWWDGAHNESGVGNLIARWEEDGPTAQPRVLVVALSGDKDVDAILKALRAGFPSARLIATRSRSERALEPEVLARQAAAAGFEAEVLPDVVVAVRRALDVAYPGPVLLTGSLFAIGEAMEVFGGAPGEML